MSTETILLFVVIILIIGSMPSWPYSRSWGYGPTGILSLLLIIFLIWVIVGGRPLFRGSGTMRDAGQELKSAGSDVADSIRRAVK